MGIKKALKKVGKIAKRVSPEMAAGGGVAVGLDLSREGGKRTKGRSGPARPSSTQRSRRGRGGSGR